MRRARTYVRLTTLARAINAHCKGFSATVEKSSYTSYRKPAGLRYITHVGKTRHGHLLTIRDQEGRRIFSHDSADPYRENREAMEWIERRWGRIWEHKTPSGKHGHTN